MSESSDLEILVTGEGENNLLSLHF